MPYIHSLGYKTYSTGAPFMRALFMDFPNDSKVANIGDEYMFGPAFLVAPVPEQGATSREVYLPADADFTLHSDDGTTYAYEKGDFKTTKLHWDDAAQKLSHEGAAAWGAPDSEIVDEVKR